LFTNFSIKQKGMGNAHHGKEKDINALKEENKRLQQQLVQLQSQKQQETTKSPVNKKRKREENEDDDEHERKVRPTCKILRY
jgi:uncharacterized protein YlxW (UPF0749 family)